MDPPDLTLKQLSPSVATTSSTEPDPPAHLAAALEAAEPGLGEPLGGLPTTPIVLMPRPEWCDLYLKCHGIAGHVMGSAVLVSVPQRAGGLDAAGAVYDTCAETPWLHFLLHPGGIWFQRASIVLLFYAPIVGELRAERAKRQAPRPPQPRPTESPAEVGGLAMPPNGAV